MEESQDNPLRKNLGEFGSARVRSFALGRFAHRFASSRTCLRLRYACQNASLAREACATNPQHLNQLYPSALPTTMIARGRSPTFTFSTTSWSPSLVTTGNVEPEGGSREKTAGWGVPEVLLSSTNLSNA